MSNSWASYRHLSGQCENRMLDYNRPLVQSSMALLTFLKKVQAVFDPCCPFQQVYHLISLFTRSYVNLLLGTISLHCCSHNYRTHNIPTWHQYVVPKGLLLKAWLFLQIRVSLNAKKRTHTHTHSYLMAKTKALAAVWSLHGKNSQSAIRNVIPLANAAALESFHSASGCHPITLAVRLSRRTNRTPALPKRYALRRTAKQMQSSRLQVQRRFKAAAFIPLGHPFHQRLIKRAVRKNTRLASSWRQN